MIDQRPASWWDSAVVYQIYPRSFADGNGDGIGDLAGFRARLPYLAELGVDAVWFTPWYPSPLADGGYDVADYRDVDPRIGTLAEAEALVAEAHRVGLRVLLDLVPNHTSIDHPAFRAALAGGPGAPERELFHFRPGRGASGELPPNNWRSCFQGSAWTRVTEPDGTPGEWYLHLFDSGQPDWNWEHPAVRADFEETLRFWFDRGVDGFRIDVADLLGKADGLPDADAWAPGPKPIADQPTVFEVHRAWRRIADSYPEPKVLVGELWKDDPELFRRYVNPHGLDGGFCFALFTTAPDASALRAAVDRTRHVQGPDGHSPWVMGNHDVTRPVTRLGRRVHFDAWNRTEEPSDVETGTRRARALALLTLALPGNAGIYQGEELGLPEVTDLPEHTLQDPVWERSGHTDRGRDGCRVPLPWEGDAPPFGFGPADDTATEPWLPQPPAWKQLTVAAQDGDPDSTLTLYRAALRLRRAHPGLGAGELEWLDLGTGVLAFRRSSGFSCVVNLSGEPVELPSHESLLLTSGPVAAGRLPVDTAAWLQSPVVEER
ncbi:alpha-glucosidase [Streptacidiphilus sp. MAP12-33]|uniref:glycoside hydrolase family 13 protein n=1 Tax=Streptacidiphilus sp. MAP12-33 TaxID=3156266 RepID=UPI0035186A4B